ncbi:MAG: glycoside hydrolase, partial [Verrucomicrobiia bacterium]
MTLLFHPAGGRAADFIPFWREGGFHLFYLRVFDDPAGRPEGTPWHQVVTRDFVSFEDWGEAIPCGADGTQDAWIFTGSIFERDGLFHTFYTGHNRHLGGDAGGRKQGVMLATSRDLRRWEKDSSFPTLFAPPGYEPDDWRDPFIFHDERSGEFGMLLAARLARGPSRHRGCLALLTSRDLREWTVREPFWAPDRYRTHEC